MKYIALEIPNHLFATKVDGVSPHPDTGEFIKYINDFVTLRVAPDTLIGKTQHLLTTYQKLQDLADFRQGYSDPSEPDYIDTLVYFVSKGVTFLPNYKFKRGKGYFALDLFIKVSNSQYSLAKPPDGFIDVEGSGEEGDADVGVKRTWKQWAEHGVGRLSHENATHKFLYHPSKATHDEFALVLNHIATINDDTKYDVLSIREFNAQVELDNAE